MAEQSRRSQRDYGMAFKLGVVGAVEKGELTYKQAQKKYGIQGRSTVLVWLRKYGQQDWSVLARALVKKQSPQQRRDMALPLTPEQRIKELEAELVRAQQQATLYKTMLDVLAREHGVGVVKKPLPEPLKSSRKSKG
jgi:transposase